MISGPCGVEVREFFSCFHDSNTKEDGNPSDCIGQMRMLDKCMSQYPELYPPRSSKGSSSSGEGEENLDNSLTASASQMELEMKNGSDGHVNDNDTDSAKSKEDKKSL